MTKYDMLLKKVNQAGSMMIEALAMLTLISLVTPTLYKKSAERTTELQDINTANQVRTLSKAVDNYTLTNYQTLLKNLPQGDDSGQITLEGKDLEGYLPYGYELKATKNFDKPIVIVKRQGNTDALTSFVILPRTGNIDDYRASQIASMVGANGGYITEEDGKKKAKGVGGVWGLDNDKLKQMLGDDNLPQRGTLVTASSESINEGSSAAKDNPKYLQRTKQDNDKWRNTMMTDLYMGGTVGILEGPGTIPLSKILGVDQLIIGDIETGADPNEASSSLVVKAYDGKPGSAFVEGSLYALGNAFSVFVNDDNNPELNFDNSLLKATTDHFSVNVTKGSVNDFFIDHENSEDIVAKFNVATFVNNDFETMGDTSLANDEDAMLSVGPTGKVMLADKHTINFQEGNLIIDNGLLTDSESSTLIGTDKLDVRGSTKISNVPEGDEIEPLRKDDLDLMLNVQGDAFVSKTLEAGEIDAHKFDTMKLYAGGNSYEKEDENDDHYIRWLNVDDQGILVRDISENRQERMRIDETESSIYGPAHKNEQGSADGQGSLVISTTDATLQGLRSTNVKTTDTEGSVSIQNGAIMAKKSPRDKETDTTENQVDIRATQMRVFGSDGLNKAFEVRAGETSERTNSYVDANVDEFVVRKEGKKLLSIVSGENGAVLGDPAAARDSVVEIDKAKFRVWADSSGEDVNNRIFEVNAADGKVNEHGDLSNGASVYVRRGAIELEGSPRNSAEYAADEGVGYIEASRFVSNNLEADGRTIVEPRYSNSSGYDSGIKYDRYMVNPAYTSVMHDIKLTTRGGARLSDILPDFINKGIYVVNNTYKDGVDFNNLHVSSDGSVRSGGNSVTEVQEGNTFSGQWASPFMGMVPAPQCPPGHARVITLTPASFQMGQTGDMVKNSDGRYYVSDEVKSENINVFNNLTVQDNQNDQRVQTPVVQDVIIQKGRPDGTTDNMHLYYLGMAPDTHVSEDHNATYDSSNTPKPLYFQQSTWLKSKVIAYSTTRCPDTQASNGSCQDFYGWAAVMGFIYPYKLYAPVIDLLQGQASSDVKKTEDILVGSNSDNKVYWNVFPVRPRSMEAYATVYCYFDRTNIFSLGNNSAYVDQYDQMHNFRALGQKRDAGTWTPSGSNGTNEEYINRLNDPQLKYNDPW